ncbi:MAG TPA: hypothetical protein DCZ63_12300, partial [Geobacter sp.]|nr:hypothetical protein [Geobacter sp.]
MIDLQRTLVVIMIHAAICMSAFVLPAVASSSRPEIVFIDSAVRDMQMLADGVRPGVDVVRLDAGRDGMNQISEILADKRDLQAIHLISHGAPGKVFLGSGMLSAESLEKYDRQMKVIANSLGKDGEILFYGCDIAKGATGSSFVQKIASFTRGNISASIDATGSALLGGNWILEESNGKSAAKTILSNNARDTYRGVLAAGTISFTSGTGFTGVPPNTAADGQGGSTDIADITIEVYAIDSSIVKITTDGALEFHSTDWSVPPIVTWSGGSGATYGMAIKSSGGVDFKLTSLNFNDWGEWEEDEWTIEALENGDSKGTRTFNGSAIGANVPLAQGGVLDQNFNNIDEVRIYKTDGSGSWFGINDIVIDNPLLPNTAPVIGNLNGDSVSYVEGASAVHLDSGTAAAVSDGDSADFNGGNITVAITANGVAGEDVLGIDTSATVSLGAGVAVGSHVSVGGVDIGVISANGSGGGNLVVDFNSNATSALVTTLVNTLTYRNSNSTEPNTLSRTISVTVNDGDGGASSAANVSIAVIGVNDAPTLAATGGTPTYTENGSAVDLFSAVSISTIESGQTVTGLTLTVSNLADGSNEILG